MKELVLKTLKQIFSVVRAGVFVTFCAVLAISLNGINEKVDVLSIKVNYIEKSTSSIQRQTIEGEKNSATVYSKIIDSIEVVYGYINSVATASEDRDRLIINNQNTVSNKVQDTSNSLSKVVDTIKKPAYNEIKQSIVYLVEQNMMGGYSVGTGTVIKVTDSSTYILTNKHVFGFEEGSKCYVYEGKKKYEVISVERPESLFDMQVVKTQEVVPGKVAVKGIKAVNPQDTVVMVGNNNGNYFMYSEGTVSGFTNEGDLLIGMPSGPGNSGSGIFTKDGYLCGLLYAGQVFALGIVERSLDTAHGLCINSEILNLFLDKYFTK